MVIYAAKWRFFRPNSKFLISPMPWIPWRWTMQTLTT